MKRVSLTILLSLVTFSYASIVDIKTTSYKKELVKTKEGKVVTKWVKPSKVVPKDTIKIVNTITNDTNKTLNNLNVTSPIDKSLEYQKGSVKSKMTIKKLFSLNGKTFKNSNELFIVGKDGKKHLATAKDYKAVRFVIDKIAPKSKETIEFLAKIK